MDWQGCYDDSWRELITDESFAQPAKMARGLIVRIFDHAFANGWFRTGDNGIIDADGNVHPDPDA
jgi:acyl-CoA synthetase (AMP-forming)/AMP-acid ligase II